MKHSLLRRLLCGGLCAALLTTSGCGDTTAPAHQEEPAPDYGSTTLMVYMVGSDLESKTAAASSDLSEMLASGIDLSDNNIVVCAGGTSSWNTDTISPEKLTTLHLTADGFAVDRTAESVSMGDAAPLADFLTYAYETYPADNYALILWDHGMGPVIGYGKDILFDDDALTLIEMKEALESSPFGGDNKLSFVGFDACLMASAELACLWDDHAEYLVASQEIEPSFGWNYAFLSQMGRLDTPALTGLITEEYMAACEAYFEEKGYDGREATLSCLDLSKAAAMEEALNALFAEASPDARLSFNEIAVRRVDTRALGRASTGSEYDLVDLRDMTTQLKELYPEKADALLGAIDELVLHNATNTEGCCGLSLYYPFFNKSYYKNEWSATYTALGLFEDYRTFLNSYADRWLATDTEAVTQSAAPVTDGNGTFTLTLSEEQANAIAASAFYIFEKTTDGVYHPLFMSHDVTVKDNTLTTRFDGNIIYGKDYRGNYFIPLLIQHDTVGDITRYESSASFQNYAMFHLFDSKEEDRLFTLVDYHLAVNNKTGKVSVSAIVPNSDEELAGGKVEDIDLDKYYFAEISHFPYYYPAYDENGALLPLPEWTTTGYMTGSQFYLADGISFETAPLTAGDYVFMYRFLDVQGNEYCSDFVPFTADGVLPEPYPAPAPVETTWESGDECVMYDGNNITLSITKRCDYDGEKLFLKIDNRNDFNVYLRAENAFVNGNISVDTCSCFGTVPANAVIIDDNGLAFGSVDDYIDINELKSLTFSLSLRAEQSGKAMLDDQKITVHFTDETNPDAYASDLVFAEYNTPFRGAFAEEQTIYEKGGVTVTLLRLAQKDNSTSEDPDAFFLVSNTSHKEVTVSIEGLSVGNVYAPTPHLYEAVPSGQTAYRSGLGMDFDTYMIDAINELAFRIVVKQDNDILGDKLCRVKLTEAADTAPAFTAGDTVLLDEQGVTMTLLDHRLEGSAHTWHVTVDNHSGKGLSFKTATVFADDTDVTGEHISFFIPKDGIPAGQRTVLEIRYYPDSDLSDVDFAAEKLSFTLHRMNEYQTELLSTFDTVITLDVPS